MAAARFAVCKTSLVALLSLLFIVVLNHSVHHGGISLRSAESTERSGATLTSAGAGRRQSLQINRNNNSNINNATIANADQHHHHRKLFKLSDFLDPKSTSERTHDDFQHNDNPTASSSTNTIPPYSLYNILRTIPHFRRELFLLHYSPHHDQFHVYINESKDGWVTALHNRIYQIMPMLAYALRHHFGHRFTKGSNDLVLLVSSGDEPKVNCHCIVNNLDMSLFSEDATNNRFGSGTSGCNKNQFAPILQFGAVFRDTTILPSLVTMPVWHHLPCLRQWQQTQTICPSYKERAAIAGVGGSHSNTAAATAPLLEQVWENLLPQIIWRGSDFGFLWCIHPQLRLIDYEMDIEKRIQLSQCRDSARGILHCLTQLWEILTPRWRAVFWSVEADLNAHEGMEYDNEEGTISTSVQLPWIDAKFTVKTRVHNHAVSNIEKIMNRYTPYEQYGLHVVTPDFMSFEELSRYRYQFDIGGGGGTTFGGTIDKLAMPGVLFHHVTSTKDYFHDDIVPWMHYIPVDESLSDLRDMYQWAIENNEQAMRISEAASEYVKSWAEPRFMEEMYNRYYVETLGRVVDAYESTGEDVGKVLKERKWTLIAKGSGKDLKFQYTKEPSA